MAGQTFGVEVHGLQALQAKLRDGRLLKPTKEFIEDLGKTARKTAQHESLGRGGKKGFGKFIFLDIEQGGNLARVSVKGSVAGIANTVEEGRRPGRRPPYTPIKKWAIAAGIVPDAKGNSAAVKQLRENIKDRGTEGVHFMRKAQEVTDDALRHGVPKTENEIRKLWDK